jgi:hypothetical protein
LSPTDYFEPLDPGETLSVQSVPRRLETYQYTRYQANELLWTVVEITDGADFWRVRTQLLDGMRSLMLHSQSSDGTEEIIHQTRLGRKCWHTIRTLKQAGKSWTVVMNHLTVERPVRFTENRDLCGAWSFEELKAFGDVL